MKSHQTPRTAGKGRDRTPENPFRGRPQHEVAYTTPRGRMYYANSAELLASGALAQYEGRVNLIFTSPPFPLIETSLNR